MTKAYLIGLDYGSESVRGVLLDAESGEQVASHVQAYRHGILSKALPDGTPLARGWALQNATDYEEAADAILSQLGRGRRVLSIGVDFTASSPMPARADGVPLSALYPDDPHAYVKLWKHGAAQPYADAINQAGGAFLDNFGDKLSGEWMLPKAAQIVREAPDSWARTEHFIEGGDWLVWRLTGCEARSLGFAAYKAQYSIEDGYPDAIVPGLAERVSAPLSIGSAAGELTADWRTKTGIKGPTVVAVAVIDSHAVLPAIHAVSPHSFVGALGTSAGYLYLGDCPRPLPKGIEGMAIDGTLRDLWCYEAGQASFGDVLAWFVRNFPRGETQAESFDHYNQAAAAMAVGSHPMLALDWWNGNRVPLADSSLSGLFVGLTVHSTAEGMYKALMESLCFGARSVLDLYLQADFQVERVMMTSGLAQNNPMLLQIMADVMGRAIEVPQIDNATAVGAAIHGAVASGLVASYGEGAQRFGAKGFKTYHPNADAVGPYQKLYAQYRALSANEELRVVMKSLSAETAAP